MTQLKPDLRAVKAAAQSQFGQIPGIEGFGIGDGTLGIYVRNAEVRNQLPHEYQGVPVEFVITGDIEAYATAAF
ncbi:MAG TPA: hypothetical protein VFB38_14835 [Chthonomonadaceae bacterium]|nr:hypothetical protein [Chthonomonadaceae bacterium]